MTISLFLIDVEDIAISLRLTDTPHRKLGRQHHNFRVVAISISEPHASLLGAHVASLDLSWFYYCMCHLYSTFLVGSMCLVSLSCRFLRVMVLRLKPCGTGRECCSEQPLNLRLTRAFAGRHELLHSECAPARLDTPPCLVFPSLLLLPHFQLCANLLLFYDRC